MHVVPGAVRRRWSRAHRRVHARIDRSVPEPVQRFVRWLRSDEFFSTSASLAYYALVSIPPMALVALWAVGAVVPEESLQGLGSEVADQSPDQLPLGAMVRGLVDVATQVGLVSVLAALWPATAYGAALGRAFTRVAPRSQRRVRGMRGRLLALVIVAVLPLAVFAGLAVTYVAPRLLPGSGWALTAASAAVLLLVVAVLVALVYQLYELRDTRPRDVAVGAAATTTAMAVATGGYLVYLSYVADFEDRYGSSGLATLVLLALWLLLVNACLIMGYRLMLRNALRRAAARESGDRSRAPVSGRQ